MLERTNISCRLKFVKIGNLNDYNNNLLVISKKINFRIIYSNKNDQIYMYLNKDCIVHILTLKYQ